MPVTTLCQTNQPDIMSLFTMCLCRCSFVTSVFLFVYCYSFLFWCSCILYMLIFLNLCVYTRKKTADQTITLRSEDMWNYIRLSSHTRKKKPVLNCTNSLQKSIKILLFALKNVYLYWNSYLSYSYT